MGSLFKRELQSSGPQTTEAPFNSLFGISGGAIYPALYALFREANLENPTAVPFSLESLAKHTAFKEIKDSTNSLLMDEERLITSIKDVGNNFIEVINQGRKLRGETPLPEFSELKFSDLS